MAVRIVADASNAIWQFDSSPSDLKGTGQLFNVADNRSGAPNLEHRCVNGEDVKSGARFLCNARAPKGRDGPALQDKPSHSTNLVQPHLDNERQSRLRICIPGPTGAG